MTQREGRAPGSDAPALPKRGTDMKITPWTRIDIPTHDPRQHTATEETNL